MWKGGVLQQRTGVLVTECVRQLPNGWRFQLHPCLVWLHWTLQLQPFFSHIDPRIRTHWLKAKDYLPPNLHTLYRTWSEQIGSHLSTTRPNGQKTGYRDYSGDLHGPPCRRTAADSRRAHITPRPLYVETQLHPTHRESYHGRLLAKMDTMETAKSSLPRHQHVVIYTL